MSHPICTTSVLLALALPLAAACARAVDPYNPRDSDWFSPGVRSPLPKAPDSARLRASFARVDITPPPGVGLAGNGPEGGRAIGYRRRLYARALVIEDSTGERLALVTADLPHISILLQREVARHTADSITGSRIGVDRLLLSATHTHSGPGHFYETVQYNASGSAVQGFDSVLTDTLARRIARAVNQAAGTLRPGRLAWGQRTVWGQTRIRSLPAMVRNEPPPVPRPGAPGGRGPAYALVDPTLTMLRVDLPDRPDGKFRPAGSWSVFAMHGTGNSPVNELFDPDVHGAVVQHLERRSGGIHLLANGAQGDVSPDWPPQSRCPLPRLRPDPAATGPFTTRRWQWVGPSERTTDTCNDVARRAVERVGAAVGDSAAKLFHDLTPEVADSGAGLPTLARAFVTLPISAMARKLGVCAEPQTGMSTFGGAPDSRSRLYGWHWLGLIDAGMQEGASSPKPDPEGCHGVKRLLLPGRATYDAVGRDLPHWGQLGVYRIGGLLLAAVPAEMTTTAGARLVDSVRAAARRAGIPAGPTALVGLANGFLQYVTTAEEYGAQYYEGGSTIYGPAEAGALARVAAALTAKLSRSDTLLEADVPPVPVSTGKRRRSDAELEENSRDTEMRVDSTWCRGDTLYARVGLNRRGGWIVQDSAEAARPLVEILRADSTVAATDDDAWLELRLEPSRKKWPPWELRWRVDRPGDYRVRVHGAESRGSLACPARP
jgi:neutral ceramidase